MTVSDTTNSSTFATPIGRNCRKPWTNATSDDARLTSCPVDISSWRAKSRRCSWRKIAVRRSCCTSSAMRPPRNRRMYANTNVSTPMPIISVSQGASGLLCLVITSSMTTFCTTGSNDWMSWPPIATPNAMYAFFLCGAMYPTRRRIQPCFFLTFVALASLGSLVSAPLRISFTSLMSRPHPAGAPPSAAPARRRDRAVLRAARRVRGACSKIRPRVSVISSSAPRRAATPAGVRTTRIERRSPTTASRATKPRSTRPSTTAVIVGLATARRSARSVDRSSPAAMRARIRNWASVRSRTAAARSSERAARLRARAARGRSAAEYVICPPGYQMVRGPNYSIRPGGGMMPGDGERARDRRRHHQREGGPRARRRHDRRRRPPSPPDAPGRGDRRTGRRGHLARPRRRRPRGDDRPPRRGDRGRDDRRLQPVLVGRPDRCRRASADADVDVAGPRAARTTRSRSWPAMPTRS